METTFGRAACAQQQYRPSLGVEALSCQTVQKARAVGVVADGATVGEGKTAFTVEVVQLDGTSIKFTVNTDKATVGEALLDLGIVAGDTTEYGLYIKTVNGVTLDYDADGAYWAFYINGEYASTGVDSTNIEAGATYTLKAEAAAATEG